MFFKKGDRVLYASVLSSQKSKLIIVSNRVKLKIDGKYYLVSDDLNSSKNNWVCEIFLSENIAYTRHKKFKKI